MLLSFSSSVFAECVSGDCQNGYGTYAWDTGQKYVGEFKDGVRHGEGIQTSSSGTYEGYFKNDKMNGIGTYTWENGDKYNGEFVNNQLEGKGIYTYPNGNSRSGVWKNGKTKAQITKTLFNANNDFNDCKLVNEFNTDEEFGYLNENDISVLYGVNSFYSIIPEIAKEPTYNGKDSIKVFEQYYCSAQTHASDDGKKYLSRVFEVAEEKISKNIYPFFEICDYQYDTITINYCYNEDVTKEELARDKEFKSYLSQFDSNLQKEGAELRELALKYFQVTAKYENYFEIYSLRNVEVMALTTSLHGEFIKFITKKEYETIKLDNVSDKKISEKFNQITKYFNSNYILFGEDDLRAIINGYNFPVFEKYILASQELYLSYRDAYGNFLIKVNPDLKKTDISNHLNKSRLTTLENILNTIQGGE